MVRIVNIIEWNIIENLVLNCTYSSLLWKLPCWIGCQAL